MISSAEELAGLSYNVSQGNKYDGEYGKYFKQTANMYLGGYMWVPIGDLDNKFMGNYDGGGHTISNLKIETSETYSGLFGYVENGTIKNITLQNCSIAAEASVGGIVGEIRMSTIENCVVASNCYISASSHAVGGVIGAEIDTAVNSCANYARVTSSYVEVGGIVGYSASNKPIQNCINYGNVTGGGRVGGIAGVGFCSIKNCISSAIITDTDSGMIGALAGWASENDYENNTLYGEVISTSEKAGAILGEVHSGVANIKNCSFIGAGKTDLRFVGTGSSSIDSCYAIINQSKVYSSGNFSGWGVITGMNDNMPMQKGLYHVAQFGSAVNAQWFKDKGYTMI